MFLAPVHGGDINQCYKLANCSQRYFLKYNEDHNHKTIITSEVDALVLFSKNQVRCPEVISHIVEDDFSILILEWIDSSQEWHEKTIAHFCENLSHLHSIKSHQYGYPSNNCIGRLTQNNQLYDAFPDYYWKSRLYPQLELAYQNNYLDNPKKY